MIHLHLSIYDGEPQLIKFHTISELCDYVQELKVFNCVWMATDGENGEVLVTENIPTLVHAIKHNHFNLVWNSPQDFHLQEYQSYEDAYGVALSLKESSPKCYNNCAPQKVNRNTEDELCMKCGKSKPIYANSMCSGCNSFN